LLHIAPSHHTTPDYFMLCMSKH